MEAMTIALLQYFCFKCVHVVIMHDSISLTSLYTSKEGLIRPFLKPRAAQWMRQDTLSTKKLNSFVETSWDSQEAGRVGDGWKGLNKRASA